MVRLYFEFILIGSVRSVAVWFGFVVESLMVVPTVTRHERSLGVNRFTRRTVVMRRITAPGEMGRFVRTGARRMALRRLRRSYVVPDFTSVRRAVDRRSFVNTMMSTTGSCFRKRRFSVPRVEVSRPVGNEVPDTLNGGTSRLASRRGALFCREVYFYFRVPSVMRSRCNGHLTLSVNKMETCGRVGLCDGGSIREFGVFVNFHGHIYSGLVLAASNLRSGVRILDMRRLCTTTLGLFRTCGPSGSLRLLEALKRVSVSADRFYRVVNEVELCRTLAPGRRGHLPHLLLKSDRIGTTYETFISSTGFGDAKSDVAN